MSGKRPLENEGSASDDQEPSQVSGRRSSKRPLLSNGTSESDGQEQRQLRRTLSIPIIREAVALWQLARWVDDSPGRVESLLRRTIQDQVEHALESHRCKPPGSIVCQIQPNTKNAYELRFTCKLLSKLHTGDRIEGEGKESVGLEIINSETKETVTSGNLSSVMTKLCILDGGFDKGERGCFTRKEFESSIIRPREGKGQLLTGHTMMQLKNGVGLFKNIRINDISHCTTNGKFKLGGSVVHSKHITEIIREAASNPLVVKDRRLKSTEKPDFPQLTDGVGRLKNIGGTFLGKLHDAGIKIVKDFLTHFDSDPKKLRQVLGGRMSNNKWEETVAHAQKYNTLCSKIPVQESSQSLSELPEGLVGCSDSLFDGPSLPSQQDSLVPTSELGLQELLVTDQHKSGANLNCQCPASEINYMFNASQENSGKQGPLLDVPFFNIPDELMPGTCQPNNVSVTESFLQSQNFNPFQGNISNAIMESQANSTDAIQDIIRGQSLFPLEPDCLLETNCFARGYCVYENEFPTGACIWRSGVGEPSHRYANDKMEQGGEADHTLSSLKAAGETNRRRWRRARAVLNLTVRKPIAKRNSRWRKVRTFFYPTTARPVVAS